MEIITRKSDFSKLKGGIITLGNFDGIHLGHQKILKTLVLRGKKLKLPTILFTFNPHPLKIISPKKNPPLIISGEQKASLIASFGIDTLILSRFTKEFASLSAKDFFEQILLKELRPKEIIIGHDYCFGKARSGTAERLKLFAKKEGIAVRIVSAKTKGGKVVSSSRIRSLILDGEITEANKLLGRNFTLTGEVIKGRGVGKNLGYPTANLKTKCELIPRVGVYATYVKIAGRKKLYKGVVNIGEAPTFKRKKTIFEVHLLDFNSKLYGKFIELFFVKFIRAEKQFPLACKLAVQIEQDIKKTRALLSKGL
ncbi:MAG: bifunctional riboflavin kinase/FAD synthetase [Deltaproteobacteria bacterium]|nr:bifunctional riboflavin kinase/FAD synthetase [Deltaproteobacteria bacterium]